jgi:hypothetical protein
MSHKELLHKIIENIIEGRTEDNDRLFSEYLTKKSKDVLLEKHEVIVKEEWSPSDIRSFIQGISDKTLYNAEITNTYDEILNMMHRYGVIDLNHDDYKQVIKYIKKFSKEKDFDKLYQKFREEDGAYDKKNLYAYLDTLSSDKVFNLGNKENMMNHATIKYLFDKEIINFNARINNEDNIDLLKSAIRDYWKNTHDQEYIKQKELIKRNYGIE